MMISLLQLSRAQTEEGQTCGGAISDCRVGLSCVFPPSSGFGVCVKHGNEGGKCGGLFPNCRDGLSCVFPPSSGEGVCVNQTTGVTRTVNPTVTTSQVSRVTASQVSTVTTSKISATEALVKNDASSLSALTFAGFIALLAY
jgi:hypothetical protein